MKTKRVLMSLAWGGCVVGVLGFVFQREELLGLRTQQAQAAESASLITQPSAPALVIEPGTESANSSAAASSRELLRLRSEVTRLNGRKRELASVSPEAERLRARLASPPASSPGGIALPPGYVRKSQAQLTGYSTPENTIQSFLWALQHHDFTNVLRALSPEEAQSLSARVQSAGDSETGYFKAMDQLPGMAIQSSEYLPDGSAELLIEIAPGIPAEKLRLQLINGEWKLNEKF